jgi:hypothetical protein
VTWFAADRFDSVTFGHAVPPDVGRSVRPSVQQQKYSFVPASSFSSSSPVFHFSDNPSRNRAIKWTKKKREKKEGWKERRKEGRYAKIILLERKSGHWLLQRLTNSFDRKSNFRLMSLQ